MAYISYINKVSIGSRVRLTTVKESLSGMFEIGTIVTITNIDHIRGYTFTDEFGNSVTEAGFDGFEVVK